MILQTNARNAMAQALATLHDGGTLKLETAGNVEVATMTFAATAFGAPATGVVTAAAIGPDAVATGGTVTKGSTYTSAAAKIVEMTAGTSGTEIILSVSNIPAGATVTVTSLQYTMPAS